MKAEAESCKGFLISCDKNREKQALRDAYNFLTEYIEAIYSDVTQELIHKKIKQDGKDINLQTEVAYNSKPQNRLLMQIETNVSCLCFIKINPIYKQIDPLKVVNAIVKDVHEQQKEITRYCHRILPVQRAFRAEHFRMLDQLDQLLLLHTKPQQIKSWMLNFKCRNNQKFNYKEILKQTQKITKKYNHFPDIYYPQWTISIQIVNHLMCLSICQLFKETNQYKLHKRIGPIPPTQNEDKQQKSQKLGKRRLSDSQNSQKQPTSKIKQRSRSRSRQGKKQTKHPKTQNQEQRQSTKLQEPSRCDLLSQKIKPLQEQDVDLF